MKERPTTVSLGLALLAIDGLIWLILGALVTAGLHPSLPDIIWLRAAMAILSWLGAATLLAACLGLIRRNRRVYPWAIFFLAIASLTFLFDDFGFTDLVVLVLHFIPLVLLIKDHTWYLPQAEPAAR